MCISKEIKKAAIDNDIKGAKELADLSGVSYAKVVRIFNGDTSVRLKDIIDLASFVGLKFKFVKRVNNNE